MPRTVTLYEAFLQDTCCPVDAGVWTFVPKEHRMGETPEGHEFILPDELDVSSSPFGSFFVVAGTKHVCKLHFSPIGEPTVTTPEGHTFTLERA